LKEVLETREQRISELENEMEDLLQRSPSKSDTSTEYDSHALLKERNKVKKLTDEIKTLYDTIDRLNLKLQIEYRKNTDKTLEKVRASSASRERQIGS